MVIRDRDKVFWLIAAIFTVAVGLVLVFRDTTPPMLAWEAQNPQDEPGLYFRLCTGATCENLQARFVGGTTWQAPLPTTLKGHAQLYACTAKAGCVPGVEGIDLPAK